MLVLCARPYDIWVIRKISNKHSKYLPLLTEAFFIHTISDTMASKATTIIELR